MCLIVKEVPRTKRDSLIVQCYKYINYLGRTPYRNVTIPRNGWLFPSKQNKYEMYYQEVVYGGYIHAYNLNRIGIAKSCGVFKYYHHAYAFGVQAYGRRDLVCNALYIPAYDKTGYDKETVKIIKSLIKRPNLVARSIVAAFPKIPRLKSALNYKM